MRKIALSIGISYAKNPSSSVAINKTRTCVGKNYSS